MKNMTDAELRKLYEDLEAELERREQEEKNKLKAEKAARYKEVVAAYENFEQLRSKYVDDYGQFTFETDSGLFSSRNFLFRW
jgi:hypothetical protein